MRAVYKYPLIMGEGAMLPNDAKIVYVGKDFSGQPCVWAEVEPFARVPNNVIVHVFGTGHVLPDGFTHAGTWVDGPFVWHAYWRAN